MTNPGQAASKPESRGQHRRRSPADGAGHLREERLTCTGHHHAVVMAPTRCLPKFAGRLSLEVLQDRESRVTSRDPFDAPMTVRPPPEMRSGDFGDPRWRSCPVRSWQVTLRSRQWHDSCEQGWWHDADTSLGVVLSGGGRGWHLRCSWRPVLASSGGDPDQPGGRVSAPAQPIDLTPHGVGR